jgi:hypothetical protein
MQGLQEVLLNAGNLQGQDTNNSKTGCPSAEIGESALMLIQIIPMIPIIPIVPTFPIIRTQATFLMAA